jgi:oligosaccharide repeat unit polymerase
MKNKQRFHMENGAITATFVVVYLAALLLADVHLASASAVLLVFAAFGLYAWRVRVRRCPADLGALLLLFWTAGLGLAILRLSSLHTPWTWQTKVSFGIFPVCFLFGEDLHRNGSVKVPAAKRARAVYHPERLFTCIMVVSIVSALTFVIEALYLGYIPIFSKDTHAYNYFHVTGLHYFTVSCMMTHALSAVALLDMKRRGQAMENRQKVLLILANVLSLSIAVMCISKLQFLLIIGLPLLILLGSIRIKDFGALPWKKIIAAAVVLLVLFAGVMVVFTYFRHYEPGYLNDIFAFRNPDTPVWVQYPYMYIANNFANFNCMTEQLTAHTYGLKQLFPVFALTGTKFIWPQLVNFPLYVVKEEINTLTIIYDAYYDFGIPGVMGFGVILGLVSGWITKKCAVNDNPVWMLLYAQIAMYMVLSFFSAWYSVATTWFWFAMTVLICFAVQLRSKKEVERHE